MGKLYLFAEVWQLLRENGKWWMAPIIVLLMLLGALMIFASTSALAPFIYTIF